MARAEHSEPNVKSQTEDLGLKPKPKNWLIWFSTSVNLITRKNQNFLRGHFFMSYDYDAR
jgi:hypothetical protein